MANKKVSQLVSKPSVLVTDLFPIADPTTGQLYKTTISDLGTAIGSGVSSVNTLVGAVVLDTDDIQELASPTNRWFTDTRARAALSASSPLAYNSGTGVFSIPAATSSQNGYLTSTDWTTFNSKQQALSGTGFVKISGTTISYDNSTYLTTSAAASTYLALAGGTLTGALNGTSANFSGDLTLTGTNPRFYLTDSDNNPDYFISNTDGTFTVYDVTNSTSRFTIGTTGNGTFGGNLTVGQIIRSGGTSSQFLKADGSVDSTAYVSGSGATGYYARFTGSRVISDGFIQTTSNITYIEGMGLSSLNGIDINGSYGGGGGGLKLRSYDETTGNAYIDFSNTGGRFYLGLNRSTASGLMTNATAYATVLTTGLGTTNLEFGTNATKRLTIDGTTGAATFTSTISAAGATLTGALSGTSATFSSRVTGNGGVSSKGGYATFEYNSSATGPTYPDYNTYFGAIGTNFSNGGSELDIWNTVGSGFVFRKQTGASAQTALLTIASTGAATFSSSVTATGLTLTTGASTAATINSTGTNVYSSVSFNNTTTGYGYDIGFGGSASIAPNSFYVYGGSSASVKFLITSGGNVGIGTTSPTDYSGYTTLHINGKSGNLGGVLRLTSYDGSSGGNIYAASSAYNFNTTTPIPFIWYTQDTERMRITSAGSVFIGKTTGSSKFGVSGLPTSSAGLSSGDFYQVAGAVMVVP